METIQRGNMVGLNFAVALDHAEHCIFARNSATTDLLVAFLGVHVLGLAAHIGFVNLNDAGKQTAVVIHGLTDAMR